MNIRGRSEGAKDFEGAREGGFADEIDGGGAVDVDKELFVAGREDLGQSWFFWGAGLFRTCKRFTSSIWL